MSLSRERGRWAIGVGTTLLWTCIGAAAWGLDRPVIFTQLPQGTAAETSPPRTGGMLRAPYGDGGRIVVLEPHGKLRVLTRDFDSACGLDVSFDGKRIIFAAKRRSTDSWNIFEAAADGSNPRQVTKDFGNCTHPAYQSTLYTIVSTEPWYQVMFLSDAAGDQNEYGSGVATNLYSARLDGTAIRRLTMNLSSDMDPILGDDGRVLLACWQRMGLQRGYRGRVAIFGVNTDGADYALYCEGGSKGIQHMPCVTADGLVVFVEADEVGWDGAGKLACVAERRPFHSYRAVPAPDAFLYHSPAPLPDGSVIVARRPAGGGGTHGLYRVDPRTGDTRLIFDSPQYHDFHAKLLAPRTEPDGRSSVVNEKYPTGKLYCMNSYLAGKEILPWMRPGMLRRLRVIEGVPVQAATPPAGLGGPCGEVLPGALCGPGSNANGLPPVVPRRFLGDVPLSADGSFHVEVPADVPIQLQVLDADGMALQTCGWIWAKHREPRGCIGCHEDPELTPENTLVQAITRPGMRLLLPPRLRRTVDFRRDVMPVIRKKCSTAECHACPENRLRLTDAAAGPFNQAYVSLLAAGGPRAPAGGHPAGAVRGKYVEPGVARRSPLIWKLFGRNTSRPWDKTFRVPFKAKGPHPRGARALTRDEQMAFVEWIDLGALFRGAGPGAPSSSSPAPPARPGRQK